MLFNKVAAKKAINVVGVSAVLTTYTYGDIPVFDVDTEVPTFTTGTVKSVKVQVEAPSKDEIINSGGLVTVDTKKLVFDKDLGVVNGDRVYFGGGTVQVFQLLDYENYTVGFANKVI